MLSIIWNVRLSVCPCVCELLGYHLNVFLPPLPEVGCPKLLEIRNPWGRVVERRGLRFKHFFLKSGLKLPRQKTSLTDFFLHLVTFEVLFKRLCAPTSRSHMSKNFRDSEFLRKSIGKKWSQIWKFLLKNCLKSPQKKKKKKKKKKTF